MMKNNFEKWKVDNSGYLVEELEIYFEAACVRDDKVFFATETGQLLVMDDDLNFIHQIKMPDEEGSARLVYVSKAGTIFISFWRKGEVLKTYRTIDGERWHPTLDISIWRMDEDDDGNIYAGNYVKHPSYVATLYKSSDEGSSWERVFVMEDNHHIHTVRYDKIGRTLYIAYGDNSTRGQAFSRDFGKTFVNLRIGGSVQGHTDVGFTDDYVFWASDDMSGNVFCQRRGENDFETLFQGSQFMWFVISSGNQIYVGTSPSDKGQRGSLLASRNQGRDWQKIYTSSSISTRAYEFGLDRDSREMSRNGWIYFSDLHCKKSFRVKALI